MFSLTTFIKKSFPPFQRAAKKYMALFCSFSLLCPVGYTHPLPERQPLSYILVNGKNGKIIAQSHGTLRRPPASLTKLVTLRIIFQCLRAGIITLETRFIMSRYAVKQPPTKIGGLKPGESLTVQQCITAIAARSANDAAVAVAENIGCLWQRLGLSLTSLNKSVKENAKSCSLYRALLLAKKRKNMHMPVMHMKKYLDPHGETKQFVKIFVHAMNLEAHFLKMSRSNFGNPTGLPGVTHSTCAKDMARVLYSLHQNFPQYCSYLGMAKVNILGRTLRNTNRLQGVLRGMRMGKTGFTQEAGYNLATLVVRQGVDGFLVVMGASSSAHRARTICHLVKTYMPLEGAPVKSSTPLAPLIYGGSAPTSRVNAQQSPNAPHHQEIPKNMNLRRNMHVSAFPPSTCEKGSLHWVGPQERSLKMHSTGALPLRRNTAYVTSPHVLTLTATPPPPTKNLYLPEVYGSMHHAGVPTDTLRRSGSSTNPPRKMTRETIFAPGAGLRPQGHSSERCSRKDETRLAHHFPLGEARGYGQHINPQSGKPPLSLVAQNQSCNTEHVGARHTNAPPKNPGCVYTKNVYSIKETVRNESTHRPTRNVIPPLQQCLDGHFTEKQERDNGIALEISTHKAYKNKSGAHRWQEKHEKNSISHKVSTKKTNTNLAPRTRSPKDKPSNGMCIVECIPAPRTPQKVSSAQKGRASYAPSSAKSVDVSLLPSRGAVFVKKNSGIHVAKHFPTKKSLTTKTQHAKVGKKSHDVMGKK